MLSRSLQLVTIASICLVGAGFTAAAALGLTRPDASQQTRLIATVGPGATIVLTHENGSRVTQLEPGTYVITVNDRSDEHNFRLLGPGVSGARTDVAFVGTTTFTVDLVQGRYTYDCEPHSSSMRGTFLVGTPPPPPAQARRNLVATVGPGNAISVRTPAGAVVRQTPAGPYRITVRDRSRAHNFHLVGPGVNRRTTVPFVGTQTWDVTLQNGRLYRFTSTPQAAFVQGALVAGTPARPIRRLAATVGPGPTIALRTPAGQPVRTTPPGIYSITVRDLSAAHNFRLAGPGVALATTVPYRGTTTWLVELRAGTYAFRCDPHAARMRGTFRVG